MTDGQMDELVAKWHMAVATGYPVNSSEFGDVWRKYLEDLKREMQAHPLVKGEELVWVETPKRRGRRKADKPFTPSVVPDTLRGMVEK